MNQRQKETQQIFLNNEKAVLKQLEGNYKDALNEINNKIAILQAREDADLQHVIYQIDYQKALKAQVQTVLDQLHNNNFETVSEYLTKSYEDGFIGTMYDLQGQGIPLVFPIDEEQVAAAIQHETKLSESLYTRLGKDTKVLSKQIAGEISRGIASASMYSEISRNIAGYCGISKNKAMRIARTESHRIQCKATADAQRKAKEKGADVVKQWDASLDGKTRDTHRELDGQIRELDEPFEVQGMTAMQPGDFGDPAEDCNCRCALLQRARWALGNDYTKWSPDAPVEISDDGTTQFVNVDAKNFTEFKGIYQDITGQMTMNMENNNSVHTQKINQLEKSGKSAKIKSITADNVKDAVKGGTIKTEVAEYVSEVLESKDAMKMFDKVRTIDVDSTIVMNTNVDKVGTFGDIVLELNKNALGDKTIEEIDSMFMNADNTVANSFKDAITHEKYHADLIFEKNYAQIESLYDQLEDTHIDSLSITAYKDGTECIAEVGVMIDRGDADKVPKDAMELFIKYMGNRL